MEKIRYFMFTYMYQDLIPNGMYRYGRATCTIKGDLNIYNVEQKIKEIRGIYTPVICTGFFEMSEEDYMSNFME